MDAHEIKALRKLMGLTQVQFARAAGADARSIARWEETGGTSCVLDAYALVLTRNPKFHKEIIETITKSTNFGGLSFLLLNLLEETIEQTSGQKDVR